MTKRTVIITGAGTGIGEACARRFAAQGDNIVLVGRRKAPLDQVAAATGGLVLVGDAADAAHWNGFVDRIVAEFAGIDVLVCCAGGMGLGTATEMDEAQWAASLHSNLNTAFESARACLPLLETRRGNIVLLGSLASVAAGPAVCGYTTAKHALLGLNRSLAKDYGPRGVRVNCICPGWVRTPMADEEMQPLMEHFDESLDEAYTRVTAEVPLRRPADADEIASLCEFLASPGASIVTGITLMADGGASVVDLPTLAFERIQTAEETTNRR